MIGVSLLDVDSRCGGAFFWGKYWFCPVVGEIAKSRARTPKVPLGSIKLFDFRLSGVAETGCWSCSGDMPAEESIGKVAWLRDEAGWESVKLETIPSLLVLPDATLSELLSITDIEILLADAVREGSSVAALVPPLLPVGGKIAFSTAEDSE
jgi:hypothetical protein